MEAFFYEVLLQLLVGNTIIKLLQKLFNKSF
jgi:hypothetical protein